MKLRKKDCEENDFRIISVEDSVRVLQGFWLGTVGVVVYIELVFNLYQYYNSAIPVTGWNQRLICVILND